MSEGAATVWARGAFVARASRGVTAAAKDDAFGSQPGVAFEVGSGRFTFRVAGARGLG